MYICIVKRKIAIAEKKVKPKNQAKNVSEKLKRISTLR